MVCRGLMELSLELFASPLSECLFQELTALTALTAYESLRFDAHLPICGDHDFDGLAQRAPPT